MIIEALGIDVASRLFQRPSVHRDGHLLLKRRVKRHQLFNAVEQIDPDTIALEVSNGAFYRQHERENLSSRVKKRDHEHVKFCVL